MKLEPLIQNIYGRTYIRVLLHIFFWCLLAAVQWYLTSISFNPFKDYPMGTRLLLLFTGTLNLVLFYYPFVYLVLPRLFYARYFFAGIIATLLLSFLYALLETMQEGYIVTACAPCMQTVRKMAPGYYDFLHAPLFNRLVGKVASFGSFILLLFTIALPLGIKMSLQALRTQLHSAQLLRDNLQLELNFLKAQVNPHFLFNTLNNLYGLILKNDQKRSAHLVERLSRFLRYSLYESGDAEAPLEKEMMLLRDYQELEAVRLNHTQVDAAYENDGTVATIAPLLMVPVFENAFKYSMDEPGALIRIRFQVQEKTVRCFVQNPYSEHAAKGPGGIGLNNFRKRLDLYYKDRYTLDIRNDHCRFTVSVKIMFP